MAVKKSVKKSPYKSVKKSPIKAMSVSKLYAVFFKGARGDVYVTSVNHEGVLVSENETPAYYDKKTAEIIAVLLRVYAFKGQKGVSIVAKSTAEKYVKKQ